MDLHSAALWIFAITIVVSLGLFKGDPSSRILVIVVFAVNVLVASATAAHVRWSGPIPVPRQVRLKL